MKLLLTVIVLCLSLNARASEIDESYIDAQAQEAYVNLLNACHQCSDFAYDNLQAMSLCKSQVNMTKANIIASNPLLNRGNFGRFICR